MNYLSICFFLSSNNVSSALRTFHRSHTISGNLESRRAAISMQMVIWWGKVSHMGTFHELGYVAHHSEALTWLISIFSSSWCAKTCSEMHFNFLKSTMVLIIHKMLLPISYVVMKVEHLCRNLPEIFGFLDSSQATPPSEVCRTMVLERDIKFWELSCVLSESKWGHRQISRLLGGEQDCF